MTDKKVMTDKPDKDETACHQIREEPQKVEITEKKTEKLPGNKTK